MKTFRTLALASMVIVVAACSSSSVTAVPAPAGSSVTNLGPGSSGFTLALPWDTTVSPSHEILCAYGGEGITVAGAAGKTAGCGHHLSTPGNSTQDADALDFDLQAGDSVRSVDTGIVRWAQAYQGQSSWTCYGNAVAVDARLADGSVATVLYAHLTSIAVSVGASVTQGAEIGLAGGTGGGTNSACQDAYAPHLHIALYTNASYTGAKGGTVAAADLPAGETGPSGPVISPPYAGAARIPGPWRDCSRKSALTTPPAGEDSSCTGLHAGDVLISSSGQAAQAPAGLSASWKWKATTPPLKPWNQSATQVLSNGRVVLFDDGNAVNPSGSDGVVCGFVEKWPPPPGPGLKGQAFNPSGAKWSDVPQTTLIDEDDADQQMPDGRLLVVGKKFYDADGDANPAAAIYDSKTNTWQAIPAPNALPSYAGIAGLTDGRIVVLDARDDTGRTAATLEAFNPKTGTWSVMWSPPATIYWEDVAALPDGTVMVYGVDSTNNNSPTLVIFDPATGKAKPVSAGSTHGWRNLQTTTSGKVVAWSEEDSSETTDQQIVRAAVFDPATDAWSAEHTVTVPWGASVLVLRDGTVITAGGTLTTGSCDDDDLQLIPQTTVTRLNPATGETTELPPMPQGDSSPWLMELADGRLLWISYPGAWIFGG